MWAMGLAAVVAGCRPSQDTYVDAPQDLGGPVEWPLLDTPGEPGQQTRVAPREPPPEPEAEVTSEALAHQVAAALRADPITADELILVYAEPERIVLGGAVGTLQAERQAMMIALSVSEGVTAVSHIRVDAPPRDDADIRVEVERALEDEPAVDAARIDVQVDAGALRLEGVVPSEVDRFVAEHLAAGVGGVRSIDNELETATPLAASGPS